MRKETSAGIIAGLVSGSVAGVAFGGEAAWQLWTLESTMRNPLTGTIHTDYTFFLTGALFESLIVLSICVCLGAIVGFMFAVGINKLPVRSTYVKATIVSIILWLVFTVAFLPRTYSWSISAGSHVEWSWSWSSLPFLPVFVLGSLTFAYLFNRWTK